MTKFEFSQSEKTIKKIVEALYENLLETYPNNDEFYEMVRLMETEDRPIFDKMIIDFIEGNLGYIADDLFYDYIEPRFGY